MKTTVIETSANELKYVLEDKLADKRIISVAPSALQAKPTTMPHMLGAGPLPIRDFIVSKFLIVYEE